MYCQLVLHVLNVFFNLNLRGLNSLVHLRLVPYSNHIKLIFIRIVKLKVEVSLSNLGNKMIRSLLEDIWNKILPFHIKSHLLHIYIFILLLSQVIKALYLSILLFDLLLHTLFLPGFQAFLQHLELRLPFFVCFCLGSLDTLLHLSEQFFLFCCRSSGLYPLHGLITDIFDLLLFFDVLLL